jgi:hypothetical protein
MTVLWLLALAAADVGGPAAKVKRLLTDVQETVTKNAADETIVLSALETFHQQLESSLSKEVQALKSTLGTLQNAQTDEITQVQSEEKELRQLHDAADGNTAIASNYEEGTKRVADKFGGVLMSMKALIALLKTSVVTPDGVLVTQEEPDENGGASRVLQAVNRVLTSHKDMVSPGLMSVFCSNSTSAPPLTPDLLDSLVKTVEEIEGKVEGKRTVALAQFESKHQKYLADAHLTVAEQEKKQGLMAEGQRHFEEVVYAVDFTKAVVTKDEQMIEQLHTYSAAERKIQGDLKVLHKKQQTLLQNLVDLLSGKFKAIAAGDMETKPVYAGPETQHMEWLWEDHGSAPPAEQTPSQPVSFLQMRSRPEASLVGIRSQIEDTLQKQGDTHAILMKIQEVLHGQEGGSPDVSNVREVLSGMQQLLAELKQQKIADTAARQKCDEQSYRLTEGEAAADASLSLLSAAKDHLHVTKEAAKTNLGGLEKKKSALSELRAEYLKMRNQTGRTVNSQMKDRETIMMALKKAHTVCGRFLSSEESGALTMMEQLMSLFQNVAELEKLHSQAEDELQGALLAYIADYEQLLADRQMHYEEALSQLALTYEELEADSAQSKGSAAELGQVKASEKLYCTSLLAHFSARQGRRDRLVAQLQQIVPKIPDILNLQRGEA